jgi:hypothetical protein
MKPSAQKLSLALIAAHRSNSLCRRRCQFNQRKKQFIPIMPSS